MGDMLRKRTIAFSHLGFEDKGEGVFGGFPYFCFINLFVPYLFTSGARSQADNQDNQTMSVLYRYQYFIKKSARYYTGVPT